MEYILKQIDPGNLHPLLISLHEDEMKIGRSTVTSLGRYNKVSRYHASFSKQNDSWYITDLKSMNYLFVNFERIQQTVRLNLGDIIGFGSPTVSKDGGFVCVLTLRSQVIVKQEPSDDDCVIIGSINSNNTISLKNSSFSINESSIDGSITGQHIYYETDKSNMSNIDSGTKNLSISSEHTDFKICKTESLLDIHQSVNVHPKIQSLTVQSSTTLNYPKNNTKKGYNLNSIELDTVSTPLKLIHVSPVSNNRDLTNAPVEYINASSEEIISTTEHYQASNRMHPICINTESSLAYAYPGIEYLEELEEFRSCSTITSNGTSKNTDLEKCDDFNTSALSNFDQVQDSNVNSHLNSDNIKQEYPEDLITGLGANHKVKTEISQDISETSENCIKSINSATFKKSESISVMDVKKSCVIIEHLPKECAQSSFEQTYSIINLPHDLVESNTEAHLNSANVKQEDPEDFITDLGANLKAKTKKMQDISKTSNSCIESINSATFQKCENISVADIKKSSVMNEHLPNDCAPSSFEQTDRFHLSNDLVKMEKISDPILSVSSQSLNNASFSDKTSKVNNSIKNIFSSYEHCNLTKNSKENVSHCKVYSKEITESTKALTNQLEHHSQKQKHNKFEIDNEVNSTKTIQLKTSILRNLKTRKSNDRLPKMAQDCNNHLVKCDSKNTQIFGNDAETNSSNMRTTKEKLDNNSSEVVLNNSIEEHSKLRNTTSQSKRNNLTVEINLKVRKNKILSSESDCEEENEILLPSRKSLITGSRPKRKKEKSKDNPVSKRSKAKKAISREFSASPYSEIPYSPLNVSKDTNKSNKAPNASPVVCSKRRHSWSDYSDEYYRSRSPSVNENLIQEETKSKTLGRTLLIDFKPMEYRSRKLRGREEWFQDRTAAKGIETVTKTSKHKPSRQKDLYTKKSNTKTYDTVNSDIERSKKRKQNICCQKRKEKIKTKCPIQMSETNSRKQKVSEVNSPQNNLKDSVRKRAMPPVPKRKNSFCSRMGFLLDTQVKCDVKSVNNHRQREEVRKRKQNSPKQPEILSSDSKLQLDLSLELDLSADKKQTPTYKTNPVKSNFTKFLTNYETENSITAAPHSISNIKEYLKIPTNKCDSDKWIPILELNSSRKSNTCEKSISDKVSDSSMLKTTIGEIIQSKDINDLQCSKKEAIVLPNHQIAKDSTKCRRKARIIKKIQASSSLLMKMIVSWNPKWLVEQKKNKHPPPLISQGSSYLNLSFSSYESYVSSYFPMIVLELWECLFRECSQHLVFEQLENCNNFCYTIKTWKNKEGLTELKCESVVSDALSYHPTEGKIVLLNVKERQERGLENYTFGCIRSHSIEEFKRGSPEWDTIPVEALNNAKLVKFEVVVKKNKRPIQLNSIYLAHGLSNIKQKLQMADALRYFRNSPLCKDIYHPREETLMFCDSSREALSWDNLNQAISEEVHNSTSKTKFLLLQAPPGTGKTKCVVELVKKLTFGNSTKFKVLVCAPSYTSLDEILHELVRSNENCSNAISTNLIKLVRLGEDERMPGNLKKYSLDGKVAKLYREDCVKKMNSRECALKLLEEKINALLFKQQTSQDMYTKINKSTSLKALVDKLNTLKCKNLLHHMDEGFRKGYECIILQESNVLLSILDCSMLPAVRTFLKGKSAAYCIVDEAAQCNELQLLQCLHHEKIEKLILFGDPQQQKPTTISKCAAKYGFGRSVFERFFLHYKKKFRKIPCPAFNKQYRMHSEICQFPSKYFYNQKLSTAEGTDKRYANFPLKPYTVLDVLDPGPIPDDTESSLIMYICSLLVQACPTATIGIILAEEGQKQGLSLSLDPEYSTIEIDTLENFQSKEKDIVLIPCMRKPSMLDEESIISCGKMLNVALTRAKQCLIICGQVAAKVEYPHWRALMDDALARNCYLCVASVTHLPLVFANYIKKVY